MEILMPPTPSNKVNAARFMCEWLPTILAPVVLGILLFVLYNADNGIREFFTEASWITSIVIATTTTIVWFLFGVQRSYNPTEGGGIARGIIWLGHAILLTTSVLLVYALLTFALSFDLWLAIIFIVTVIGSFAGYMAGKRISGIVKNFDDESTAITKELDARVKAWKTLNLRTATMAALIDELLATDMISDASAASLKRELAPYSTSDGMDSEQLCKAVRWVEAQSSRLTATRMMVEHVLTDDSNIPAIKAAQAHINKQGKDATFMALYALDGGTPLTATSKLLDAIKLVHGNNSDVSGILGLDNLAVTALPSPATPDDT